MTTDLSDTTKAKSDQLNADDLFGGPITVRITRVRRVKDPQQPTIVNYEGDEGKPFKPCLSMRRVLLALWGSDGDAYVGRELTLFRDPTAKFQGKEVGGVRISHASHIDKTQTLMLTVSRGVKEPYTVHPLQSSSQVDHPTEEECDKAIAMIERASTESLDGLRAGLRERNWSKSQIKRIKSALDGRAS